MIAMCIVKMSSFVLLLSLENWFPATFSNPTTLEWPPLPPRKKYQVLISSQFAIVMCNLALSTDCFTNMAS